MTANVALILTPTIANYHHNNFLMFVKEIKTTSAVDRLPLESLSVYCVKFGKFFYCVFF